MLESWGRYPKRKQKHVSFNWINFEQIRQWGEHEKLLAFGLGRSYGDCCLNSNGILIWTKNHNRFIEFNVREGILRAQSGVSLEDIIKLTLPLGWFLPVTPGTKYVTLGGAIANDVHGKNHHQVGSFGCFVDKISLINSHGEEIICSPFQHKDLFCATIGGLGLSGIINWAEIKLLKIANAYLKEEIIKFDNIDDYFSLTKDSDGKFAYTVSWIDCFSSIKRKLKGLFIRGNHINTDDKENIQKIKDSFKSHSKKFNIIFDFPNFALNSFNLKMFNWLYYNKQFSHIKKQIVHYDSFFYPLDSVDNWNKIYGKRGFLQYQFVIPFASQEAIVEIFNKIKHSKQASFLAVLKNFGKITSPGFLSFPREGITLALDLPMNGNKTLQLMDDLDKIVYDAKGALYPAKDARMSEKMFYSSFSDLEKFKKYIDPRFSSDLWRRVNSSNSTIEC